MKWIPHCDGVPPNGQAHTRPATPAQPPLRGTSDCNYEFLPRSQASCAAPCWTVRATLLWVLSRVPPQNALGAIAQHIREPVRDRRNLISVRSHLQANETAQG